MVSKKNARQSESAPTRNEARVANLSLAMNSDQRRRRPILLRFKRHHFFEPLFFETLVQVFSRSVMVMKKHLKGRRPRVVRPFSSLLDRVKTPETRTWRVVISAIDWRASVNPESRYVKALIGLLMAGPLAARRLAFVSACFLVIVANPSRASDQTFKDAAALIDHLEQLYQGGSSEANIVMEIRTPDYARRLVLHGMTQGDDFAYFQILEPKKDRGIASLMRDQEMWNFLPKINRVVKVPPSMMMNSWMGSDFSNDDLVKQSTLTDLYDLAMTDSETQYFVSLTPREDTVTVWGRIDYVIEKSPLIPRTQTYFDERGEAVRRLEFSEVKQFGARALPSKMTMTPLKKEGHQTIITYDSLALDVTVPDEVFTLQYLKRRR